MNLRQTFEIVAEKIRRNQDNKFTGNVIIQNGTYRFLHCGHIKSFEDMRELADNFSDDKVVQGAVYIFVDSKKRVQEIKPGAFCMEDDDRIKMIEGIKGVTRAFIFDSIEELQQEIKALWTVNKMMYKDLVYCKGEEYISKPMNMKEFIESIGGKVKLLPYDERYSSTKLIKEIQGKK